MLAKKLGQLMALCAQLEQQIDAATAKQTALLNAVMAERPPTSPKNGGL
jgi:type I restriction enzyme, S subunit